MARKSSTPTIVLTGASSGIGRATAHELAERGANLVLAARDAHALDTVVRECEERGGRAIAVPTDVTSEAAVRELARRAISTFGGLDVWINNAAVALFGKFTETPTDAYRRVIETNYFGYVYGSRAALEHFRHTRRGTLINIDSVTGGAPQPYTSAYVASKAAVRALSACLRMELELEDDHQIHVCNVMPAAIDTPLFQHAANFTGRAVKALSPVYPPEKVARAIASLLKKPQRELVVGNAGRVMIGQSIASKAMYEKAMARQIDRDHLRDTPSGPTRGNLFEPKPPHGAKGGWKEDPETMAAPPRWSLVVAGAALAMLGAIAYGVRRP